MAYGFSAVIPLQISEEDGHYALTKTLGENAKQNLKNLLLTNPGERVMLPEFGVGISTILFENRESSIEAVITDKIESQVARWLPFIKLNNVDYNRFSPSYESQSKNMLEIKIFYTIPSINFHDLLTINKFLNS